MQILKHQVARQQSILKHLGYYKGKIDGIWSVISIEAKRAFESSTSFNPGVPNNGLPFPNVGPYPKGLRRDTTNPGLLSYEGFDPSEDEKNLEATSGLVMKVVDAQLSESTAASGPYTEAAYITPSSPASISKAEKEHNSSNSGNSSDSAESISTDPQKVDIAPSKATDAPTEEASETESKTYYTASSQEQQRKKRKFDSGKQQHQQSSTSNRNGRR